MLDLIRHLVSLFFIVGRSISSLTRLFFGHCSILIKDKSFLDAYNEFVLFAFEVDNFLHATTKKTS